MTTHLLLISGSTRAASTNSSALRTAATVAPDAITTDLFDGLADLPAFSPDANDNDPHPAVAGLRRRLSAADAVLFCVPEYAGTLPGSLKNLLDWTVGSGEFNNKPVAWINVANPGRGHGAAATLASVLTYLDAVVVTTACLTLPVARDLVGPDGLIDDAATREALVATMTTLVRETPG